MLRANMYIYSPSICTDAQIIVFIMFIILGYRLETTKYVSSYVYMIHQRVMHMYYSFLLLLNIG